MGKQKTSEFLRWERELLHVLAEVENTMKRKHHDYGVGNIADFGLLGVIVRLSDKMSRLKNLAGRGVVPEVPETLDDTLIDLVGYGIIALMVNRGVWDSPRADAEKGTDEK